VWRDAEPPVRAALRLPAPVRIRVTRHPALLVTWGFISPVILLPAGADTWPAERVRVVLAHEMAHLARRDWVTQLAAEVVRAIHWFNPLFWLACARLRQESEHASDDIVLDLGFARTSYATHLVDLARAFSTHGRTWLPAPSIARPSTLERRVCAMLNPHINRQPVSLIRRTAMVTLLLAAALPIAAASQSSSTTSGTVVDPSGLPLPNAPVTLTGAGGAPVFETTTDATGAFQFPAVPSGEYMLSSRTPGFSSLRQRVQIGGPTTLSMQLQVGTLRETVTVRGGETFPAAAALPMPAAPPCGSTSVGGNLKPPKKLLHVSPKFRQAWVDAGVQGSVLLQARIGTDGKISSVEVVSPSHQELEDEALAAVSQWQFSPTYLNCEPVEVRMFVTVSFTAER
jgi:TonB family protein